MTELFSDLSTSKYWFYGVFLTVIVGVITNFLTDGIKLLLRSKSKSSQVAAVEATIPGQSPSQSIDSHRPSGLARILQLVHMPAAMGSMLLVAYQTGMDGGFEARIRLAQIAHEPALRLVAIGLKYCMESMFSNPYSAWLLSFSVFFFIYLPELVYPKADQSRRKTIGLLIIMPLQFIGIGVIAVKFLS